MPKTFLEAIDALHRLIYSGQITKAQGAELRLVTQRIASWTPNRTT